MNIKKQIRNIVTAVILTVILCFIQRIVTPKYVSEKIEGRLIEEYYEQEERHDVIFIGDCEVYENFSPVALWENYGISSYIRGSAQQLIWQSYYLLEDTLRYETPDVVVFNVLSMKYNEPQREAYNRITLEGMRWSPSKVKAICTSMMPEEKFLDYVFPLLRYHDRWDELKTEDVEYMFHSKQVSHNGYYMRVDVRPAKDEWERKMLAEYQFGDRAYEYLDKLTNLCKEKDIQLILIKAPSLYPYWYKEWEEQVEKYADENDLLYINFLELLDETGVDFSQDTYDAGLHMNVTGAEKITKYLGQVLSEDLGLKDHRGESDMDALWKNKVSFYKSEKERMYKELNVRVEEGR